MFTIALADDLPRKQRKGVSRFESTKEWPKLKAVLDAGVKYPNCPQVGFTRNEMSRLGISNQRTIARFLQKYIEDNQLELTVTVRERDGVVFFTLRPPEPKTTGRRTK